MTAESPTLTLEALGAGIPGAVLFGDGATEVSGIAYDSRKVAPGDLFVALQGEASDGREFVAQALEAGAVAVAASGSPDPAWNCPSLEVPDARMALAEAAAALHGNPSADLEMVGITGTNGKTTTAFLIHHLLNASMRRAGLIGTVHYHNGEEVLEAPHTTPQSADLQSLLADMRERGCRAAVMEVSSHGIDQHRVHAVEFNAAVFTNLTRDHLDYHGDMESYFEAKRALFSQAASADNPKRAGLIVNGDDRYGRRIMDQFSSFDGLLSYGMGVHCHFRAVDVRSHFGGTTFKLATQGREYLVRLPLIGGFNAYNALAALATARSLGMNLRESIQRLAEAPQVPGRLESVAESRPFKVYVDYAHTPDALENALKTIQALGPRRLITVFGCGGDRDKGKRALMGAVACRYSTTVILTSDNPRTEDPAAILKEIERGCSRARYTIIEDRREAIQTALQGAGPHDVVLVAGKGHETYQEINGTRHHFDDRAVVRAALGDIVSPRDFAREDEEEPEGGEDPEHEQDEGQDQDHGWRQREGERWDR